MTANEKLAAAIGSSRRLLRQRLLEARSVLFHRTSRLFTGAKLDFENKRLVGYGYALQWSLRNRPDLPESYENQQTNRGIVSVVQL